jgi:hypothetical protein
MFLTGLSLGGGGVWKYATNSVANASQFADRHFFAEHVNGPTSAILRRQILSVWSFHAQDDGVVGVGCTTAPSACLILAILPLLR